MSLKSFPIVGLTKGLKTDVKPAMLPDQAFALLQNAYTFRERELKREGRQLIGRLTRTFTNIGITRSFAPVFAVPLLKISGYITNITNAVNAVVTTPYPHNLSNGDQVFFSQVNVMTQINDMGSGAITVIDATHFSTLIDSTLFTPYNPALSGGFWMSNRNLSTVEPNAQVVPGSVTYIIQAGPDIVFTDNGNGTMSSVTPGNSATINYITGIIVLTTTAVGTVVNHTTYSYYPSLPSMGIWQEDQAAINDELTIFFDTRYAYIFSAGMFQEYIPGTAWNSTDSDFFWCYNYRGVADNQRLFFETNFVNTVDNPMFYTDGSTWTKFLPIIADTPESAAQSVIFTCRILIAYYGRLLALNTWEGLTASGNGNAANFFNRCRFSAVNQSPVDSTTWRSDKFGLGGFIDAPTNEAIINATFVKNTLIVEFEQSTWQLRYIGEYGFPFVWERVSSDFGSESTFSAVLFDNHMLSVGDKGIISSNGVGAQRIDLDIPDTIFNFKNANNGVLRVWGVRDYQRELVFWNYANAQQSAAPGVNLTFPNQVLVYNYRNNTWAINDDSVTCWGTFQSTSGITWASTDTFWGSNEIFWGDPASQSLFPLVVCGNQQGFITTYGKPSPTNASTVAANDQQTLTIEAVTLTASPNNVVITSPNHNLQTGSVIYITSLQFADPGTGLPIATSLNNTIYGIRVLTADTFQLRVWSVADQEYYSDFPYTPSAASYTYIGVGYITVFPRLSILTKDINIFQAAGLKTKLSYIDFLMEPVEDGAVTVNLCLNASSDGLSPPVVSGNDTVGQKDLSLDPTPSFYTPGSDYALFRFYATLYAQYFSINITYSEDLMNTFATHSQPMTLYAINAWCREGGKSPF